MALGIDGTSGVGADLDYSTQLSVHEQAADIAQSGDEQAAIQFLSENPTARSILGEALLHAGQFGIFNNIESNPALPYQVAQTGATTAGPVPGSQAPTFSGISPSDLARIGSALRAGSFVGLAVTLTTPPPRPHTVQIADDAAVVFNVRRYEHHFYFKGDDGKWRQAPVRATGSADGLMVVDLAALSRAYGGNLPANIVNMTTIGADALQGASVSEARARPSGVPSELQTTSKAARTALGLSPHDQMQAHHLIPANVWGNPAFSSYFSQAQTTGWQPDEGNLIALPATQATQVKLMSVGHALPIHNTSHPVYDAQVTMKLTVAFEALPPGATPAQIHAVIDTVAASMATELQSGLWMPRLR